MKTDRREMEMRHTSFRKAMALESSSNCSLVSCGSASVRWGKMTLISGQRSSHFSWSWWRKSLTASSRRALRSTLTCSWRYLTCSGVRNQDFPMRTIKRCGKRGGKAMRKEKRPREKPVRQRNKISATFYSSNFF